MNMWAVNLFKNKCFISFYLFNDIAQSFTGYNYFVKFLYILISVRIFSIAFPYFEIESIY